MAGRRKADAAKLYFRVNPEVNERLNELSRTLGISRNAALCMAITKLHYLEVKERTQKEATRHG